MDITALEALFLNASSNLSDLTSATTARTNLGLGTAATRNTGTGGNNILLRSDADARYLLESSNLSDLTNAATARTNLGLGTAATRNTGTGGNNILLRSDADARYLLESSNLSDLTNAATARTNLGLGNAALRTVGTAANNLIENSRFSQAFMSSGRVTFPNGFIIQWLSERTINNNQTITLTYPVAFPNVCFFAGAQKTSTRESDRTLNFASFPGRTSASLRVSGGGVTNIPFVSFFAGN